MTPEEIFVSVCDTQIPNNSYLNKRLWDEEEHYLVADFHSGCYCSREQHEELVRIGLIKPRNNNRGYWRSRITEEGRLLLLISRL